MPKMRQYQTTYTRVPTNRGHGMAQEDMQVMQSLVADGGASEFRDADACGDATVSGQGDAPHTEVKLHSSISVEFFQSIQFYPYQQDK